MRKNKRKSKKRAASEFKGSALDKKILEIQADKSKIESDIKNIQEKLAQITKESKEYRNYIFERNDLLKQDELIAVRLRRLDFDSSVERKKKEREEKGREIIAKIAKRQEKRATAEVKLSDSFSEELTIPWNEVFFHDERINFKIKGHYTEYYYLKTSKKSFNYLKPLFKNKNLPPLLVKFKNNKPTRIENLEEINNVIEVLIIEDYFRFTYLGSHTYLRLNMSKFHLAKSIICKIYGLYNKSVFFDKLISILGEDQKVIPVSELILNSEFDILKLEESFIFPVKRGASINMIWESIIEKKATYIFSCAISDYDVQLQKIFDFISSPVQKNKRETLILSPLLKRDLGFVKKVYHEIPTVWIGEIGSLIK